MQSLVTVIKGQSGDYRITLYLSPLFLFMISQITLCFLSSAITSKLEKTRTLCNNVLQHYSVTAGKSRANVKKMIILLDAKRNMSIFGVFTLSSGLPLSLLAIVASYTIVLFQFALL
ncbi:hypothetical protein O0L34_g8735 [Tuta absoluta]|nr:hypothetical protein O0L34_g8735 [Tuta absoluta]